MLNVMLTALIKIFVFALSVFIVANILPKIRIKNFYSAITVSIVYGIFNFIAYYIFGIFTWSFGVVTLGIGFLVVNTILLVLTDKVVDSFKVDSLFWAAVASLLISFFNSIIYKLLFPRLSFEWLSHSFKGQLY